jgi:hypothetical protein
MQLNEPANRQRQLTLAVLGLLGAAGVHAEPGSGEEPPTQIDSGLLYYQEGDNRVRDVEAIVNVRQPLSEDSSWSARLLLDAVCGGSPNGAIPSKKSQTFATPNATSLVPASTQTTTSASGGGGSVLSLCSNPVKGGVYTTAPGQLPIDQSFHDERIALSGGYESKLGKDNRFNVGGAFSHELDFVSTSLNGSFARDFDAHNTTVSAGVNLEADFIQPIGGAPIAWSAYDQFKKDGNKQKQVEDLLLGVTQVMTRRWLTQLNVSLERASGYLNDPYKIVTEVDAQGNDAAGAYVYENRPDRRNRVALYWDNKYAFNHDVLELSYRHMTDSWGIRSDTIDTRYRLSLGEFGYLEPHWRGYRQSAADFFHFYLFQGTPASGYASADPRLAQFTGQTFGMKYGLPLGAGGEVSMRLERYAQHGPTPSDVPIGLQGLNLLPDLRAWIVQAGVRFEF